MRAHIDGPWVMPERMPGLDPRPLYLQPHARCRVELDGPTLRVRVGGSADRLFPLRRISRVYSDRRVDWAWPAVVACAERGITLVVTGEEGEVVGRLLGRLADRTDLRQRFLDFLERADWQPLYEQWREAKREQAALVAARRLRAPVQVRRSWQLARWCDELAATWGLLEEQRRVRRAQHGLLFGWMAHWLQGFGFDAGNEQAQVGVPNLVADFSDILGWGLEPGRVGWMSARLAASDRRREAYRPAIYDEIVRQFERRTAHLERDALVLVRALQGWLLDLG
jgi:hypothetical protein